MFQCLAFYQFRALADLECLRSRLLEEGKSLGLRGKVILSEEGLNGTICGLSEACGSFQKKLEGLLGGTPIESKLSPSRNLAFRRFLVKIKPEIIPGGVDPRRQTASSLPARTLQSWLEAGRSFTFLDTRNTYEIEYGTFVRAEHLGLRHFRNFFPTLQAQKDRWDLKQPLVMFCTGGIRCEKAAILAQQVGFEEVYQLEGGILKYFEEVGGAHYQGSCFVFDERVALTPGLEEVASGGRSATEA